MATTARFSGQWSADLVLDYNHFEWLGLVYEDYSFNDGLHHYQKSDDKRIRSFTIKAQKKNRMVHGPNDELHTLLGCLVTSFQLSYESSSTSAVKVTLRGLYVDEKLEVGNIDTLKVKTTDLANNPDQGGNARNPVEWGCLCTLDDGSYTPIANTEKVTFTMQNSVTTIPNCGSRFDGDFYEKNVGATSITTTVYSRNPAIWYQKIYSGGYDSTKLQPLGKALKPIDALYVISRDVDTRDVGTISTATNYAIVKFNKVYVKSMAQNYSSTSAIVDSPSIETRSIEIFIKSETLNTAIVYNDGTVTTPVTVTFKSGADTDSTISGIPSPITVSSGSTVSIPVAAITRTGYTFKNWTDGTNTYNNGQDIVISANTTLTAVWTANTYTIEFKANGGTGTMANLAMTYDVSKALTANAFTAPTGKTFAGWSTSQTGTAAYANQATVKNLTAVNGGIVSLYAVWQ